jgi:methylglyoxal synthase
VVKRIALTAHDGRKHELPELVGECFEYLRRERLVATAGSGKLVARSVQASMSSSSRRARSEVISRSGRSSRRAT